MGILLYMAMVINKFVTSKLDAMKTQAFIPIPTQRNRAPVGSAFGGFGGSCASVVALGAVGGEDSR